MVDKRINELPFITNPTTNDVVPLVSFAGTEPVTSQIKVNDLRGEPKPIAIADKHDADVLAWDNEGATWKNIPFLSLLTRFFKQVHSAVAAIDAHASKVVTFTGDETAYVPAETGIFLVNTSDSPNTLWRSTGTEAGNLVQIGDGIVAGAAVGAERPSGAATDGSVYLQYKTTADTTTRATWVYSAAAAKWLPISGYIWSSVDPRNTAVNCDFASQHYYLVGGAASTGIQVTTFVGVEENNSLWVVI